jgi:glycosyltransferase involved in cell wall biosynthesis
MVNENSVLLSIGIPNYNYGLYIEQTIKSVIQQEGEDIEILISDNCSTDNSWEIIQSFSDIRIKKWRQTENLGMHGNWNFLLNNARGKYFLLFSSDDFLANDFIKTFKTFYKKVQNNNIETIVWGYGNYKSPDHTVDYVLPVMNHDFELRSVINSGLEISHFSPPWAHAQLTTNLINSGGFSMISRRPDTLLFYKSLILNLDQKVLIIKKALSFQRIHGLNERNNQSDYVFVDNVELSKSIRAIEKQLGNKFRLNLFLTVNIIFLLKKSRRNYLHLAKKSLKIFDYFILIFFAPLILLILACYSIYPYSFMKKVYEFMNI